MQKFIIAALAGAALVSSPTTARQPGTADAQLQKLLAGRVAGKATDCINLPSASSSQIIDGKAIVYRVGSTLFVNEPRAGAESLERDDILVTRTFGSQLCSIDTVRLLDQGSHVPRSFVTLGKFVPYKIAKSAS